MNVKVKKLNENATIPKYATSGAACFDLHSAEDIDWNKVYVQGMYLVTAIIPTGLAFEIPEGYRMDIYPRSGWGFKHNIQLANGTGKIDSDYRGEVMVKLIGFIPISDFQKFTIQIKKGIRFAQAEINPVIQASFSEVETLSSTDRDSNGFGSTGV